MSEEYNKIHFEILRGMFSFTNEPIIRNLNPTKNVKKQMCYSLFFFLRCRIIKLHLFISAKFLEI